jgi:hypothetical protein
MQRILLALVLSFTVSATALANQNWNVRIAPVSFLVGMVNAEVGYAVGSNFSLAAGVMSWNAEILDYTVKAGEVHGRFDYWFSGAFKQGWYLSGVLSRFNIELTKTESNVDYKAATSYSGYKVLAGYRWHWTNFNLELGGGIVSYGADSKLTLEASNGDELEEDMPSIQGSTIEFNLGWSF